jgi:hypothetical protein
MLGGPWGAAIGAGAGLGLGAYQGKKRQEQEERDIELAAATQQYSPWTGLKAGPINRRDQGAALMTGALSGAQMYGMGKMGQVNAANQAAQLEQQKAQTALMKSQAGAINRMGQVPVQTQITAPVAQLATQDPYSKMYQEQLAQNLGQSAQQYGPTQMTGLGQSTQYSQMSPWVYSGAGAPLDPRLAFYR